eukprot:1161305-Pelagomonas_calceolata.AAC.7
MRQSLIISKSEHGSTSNKLLPYKPCTCCRTAKHHYRSTCCAPLFGERHLILFWRTKPTCCRTATRNFSSTCCAPPFWERRFILFGAQHPPAAAQPSATPAACCAPAAHLGRQPACQGTAAVWLGGVQRAPQGAPALAPTPRLGQRCARAVR